MTFIAVLLICVVLWFVGDQFEKLKNQIEERDDLIYKLTGKSFEEAKKILQKHFKDY